MMFEVSLIFSFILQLEVAHGWDIGGLNNRGELEKSEHWHFMTSPERVTQVIQRHRGKLGLFWYKWEVQIEMQNKINISISELHIRVVSLGQKQRSRRESCVCYFIYKTNILRNTSQQNVWTYILRQHMCLCVLHTY